MPRRARRYARRIGKQTPRQAVVWCERILELDLRYGCLKVTAKEWYQKDAVAAEVWLQASPLDEEDRRVARTPKSKKKRAQRGAAARAADAPQ